VQPIATPQTFTAAVYLPGTSAQYWYSATTLERFSGGQSHSVSAPLQSIPVFYRGGAIITRRERARRSSALMERDPFTLIIALDQRQSAKGELYIDDGASFDHQSGHFILRRITFADDTLTFTQSTSAYVNTTAPLAPSYNRVHMSTLATVERIVIAGLTSDVVAVTLRTSAAAAPVVLTAVTATTHIIIRKPNAFIRDDFTITLTRQTASK